MYRSPYLQAAVVTLAAAVVMLTNLGGPRLWDRDEPRNAGCAREMLERGDWIVPTFNAELRPHKPVLQYWCIMAAYSVGGVSEFTARLPSALFAMGTVLCTWFIGRRLFGGQAGMWAGLALASSMMFGVAGRAATPDATLIFCSTLALTIYTAGTFKPRLSADDHAPDDQPLQLKTPGHYFPQHWPMVVAMYAAMGLAVLAKGPIGLVLPTAVVGMFLLIVRRTDDAPTSATWLSRLLRIARVFEPFHFLRTCWTMRLPTALATVAVVALPWYWAVNSATGGEFLQRFLWVHNVGRALEPMDGHHGGMLWFYPAVLLLGFFPWTVFVLPMALDAKHQLQQRNGGQPGTVLALCWVGVYVVLFSLAQTKLPSYVSPCYPGLAILFGNFMERWTRDAVTVARWWMPLSLGTLIVDGLAYMLITPQVAKHFLPGEEGLAWIGLTIVLGGLLSLVWVYLQNRQGAAITFAVSTVAFATLLFSIAAQRTSEQYSHSRIIDAARRVDPDPKLAAFQIIEPSFVFYAGRPIPQLFSNKQKHAGVTPAQSITEHLEKHPESIVILLKTELACYASQVPNLEVLGETSYSLKNDHWVLVGRKREPRVASSRER